MNDKKSSFSFLAIVLFVALAIFGLGYTPPALCDQGVTAMKVSQPDVPPLIGTNQLGMFTNTVASSSTNSTTSYSGWNVVPGSVLYMQATMVADASGANAGILWLYGSDDGVVYTTSPVGLMSVTLNGTTAVTSCQAVATNLPCRFVAVGKFGTTQVGNVTCTNVVAFYGPNQK